MSETTYRTAELKQLAELIDGQRVAMITTDGGDGQLGSRPMTLLELDPQGRFWFFIEHDPVDGATALRHRQVNLAFNKNSDGTYVSVTGEGQILHDTTRNQALWTAAAKPWFPDGPTSPRLGLLCVQPKRAEYWNAPDSAVVRSLAMAASIVSGKPVGMGEHGVLDTSR